MTNHEHPTESEPGLPDHPNDALYIARKVLIETINSHARARLRYAHPLVKIAAELIDTGEITPPYPTGDLSTLPPGLREYVQQSLLEEEQAINGTPQPTDTPPPETPQ